MNFLTKPKYYIPLALISTLMAILIALRTRPLVHPDEIAHTDAICYFETHLWPPDLNADNIRYSSSGWSRVYTGEVVYIVYGQIAALLRPIAAGINYMQQQLATPTPSLPNKMFFPLIFVQINCQSTSAFGVQGYRLFNVALYLITTLSLLHIGKRHPWAIAIGACLLSIPQIIYIYAYANSEGWGISFSIALFLFVVINQKEIFNSRNKIFILGLLTALVLLSKTSFWLSIPFSYSVLGWEILAQLRQKSLPSTKTLLVNLILFIITIFLIAGPLKIIYPLTQGDFAAAEEQMRELHAANDFKPSNLTAPAYRLADKGISFWEIITLGRAWYILSAKSFYGVFGMMNIFLPDQIYSSVILLAFLNIILTLAFTVFNWSRVPSITKIVTTQP